MRGAKKYRYTAGMADSRSVTAHRLLERMDEIGCSQSDLADAINVSQAAISDILSGKTRNSRFLAAIAENLGVNLAWLRGTSDFKIDMFDAAGEPITEADAMRIEKALASRRLDYVPEPSPHTDAQAAADLMGAIMIPQLAMGYSMGGGSVIEEWSQTSLIPFPKLWLGSMTKGSASDLFIASGQGDSMMPTVLDGDLCLIDTAQKRLDRQDGLWCLTYGGFGMIKRVRALPDGGYQINSDNPAVSPITAYDGEMYLVGRVAWIMRKA